MVVARGLRDVDGRQIPRVGEGAPERDGALVLILVVLGRPHLIVELEGFRRVVHDGGRRHVGAARVGRLFERRQIDEWLEHRPGLTPRDDGAVVLRLVVRAPADERKNLTRPWVDRDKRCFGLAAAPPPREQLVDMRQTVAHGVLREPLQVEVERGVDVDFLIGGRREARILVGERLADEVDEVRRFGFERALHDRERLTRGAIGDVLRDVPGIDHRLEHHVSALAASVGIVERRERRGRLDDAGNRRGLGKREVAHIFAEKETRRFGHSRDGERSALSERDVVQIHLEDFVLRRAVVEDDRRPLFEELAPDGFLARHPQRHTREAWKEDVPDQLLRDGARARRVRAVASRVLDERANHPNRIDAGMLVESAVFDGEDGVHHSLGNHRKRHLPPLFALAARERRQDRRFERHPFARVCAKLQAFDATCRRGRPGPPGRLVRVGSRGSLKHDADDLALVRGDTRQDGHRPVADRELAWFFHAPALRISEIVEPVDQLAVGERLAASQFERTSEDARQHAVALAMQARVDEVPEAHPVVRGRET